MFSRRIGLYFDVIGLKEVKPKRAAFLLNLSENAFRVAEPIFLINEGDEEENLINGFLNYKNYWKRFNHLLTVDLISQGEFKFLMRALTVFRPALGK